MIKIKKLFKKNKKIILIPLCVALFFLWIFSRTNPEPTTRYPNGIRSKTANCLADRSLPDPDCTPGDVLATSTEEVCVKGYSNDVRNISKSTRTEVFTEYNIPYQNGEYEIDHLISLKLGGSNDISNLFPMKYDIIFGANSKNKFEDYLYNKVCNGEIPIEEAQFEISSNWLEYYKETSLIINIWYHIINLPKFLLNYFN